MKNIAYLIYRRIRPGFGIPLGFVLMYGSYVTNFGLPLLLAGLGFFSLELFGSLYNDYWDYEEDIRNSRKDKFTTCNILTRKQTKNASLSIAVISLVILVFSDWAVFLVGAYYAVLFICYSHPAVRLKGRVKGYITLASTFLFLPLALAMLTSMQIGLVTLFFSLYCFSQSTYILCQKDSTDPHDFKNIFKSGWKRSTVITIFFGVIASLSLLAISFIHPILILVWVFNLIIKFLNINKIRTKTITRTQRSRIVLLEFLTPYLFLGGGFI